MTCDIRARYCCIFSNEFYQERPFLFQTYADKTNIPSIVFENIKEFAPEYEHKVYDNTECEIFLREHFDESVVNTFLTLRVGAHKADLIRYCLLYIYGGVYLDIKTELISPLRDIFKEKRVYTVLSKSNDHIYQGILSAPARLPFFSELIQFIVTTGNPSDYHLFCKDFYHRIEKHGPVHTGLNGNFYLFEEKCSTNQSDCHDGLDKYGLCCHVWDRDVQVFKTRRASYPW